MFASGLVSPSDLAQYGPVGIIAACSLIAVAYLFKRMSASWDRERTDLVKRIDDATRRGDRLEDQLTELNTQVQTQTMAALNEANRAVSDAISRLHP